MGLMPNQNSIQMLKKLVPLNLLSEEDLGQLLESASFNKDKAGTYIFRQGDTDYHNVYLLSGQVALLDKMREVDRVTAGSETARFPLAHQIPRKNSVRAIGRVEYVLIDNRKLSEMLVKSSDDDYKVTDLNSAVTDDWMAQLLQSKVFQQIPAANIQGVIMRMEEVKVRPGESVIEQGGEGDYFYLIHQGQCTVLRKAEDEEEPTELAKLGPGDSFGEEALLSDSPRNSTVKMLTDGILLRLSKDDFIEFVKRPLARGVKYEEAVSMVKSGAVWLDVRPPDEYETGHLGNSVSLPLNTMRYQASNLAPDQHYVICCGDGQMSATAAFLLTDRGYDVSVLEGGLRSVSDDILVRDMDQGEETSAKVISLHSGEEIAEDSGPASDPKELELLKRKLVAANKKIKDLGVRYHGFKEKQQKEAAQREAELKAKKVILETTRSRLEELKAKRSGDQKSLKQLEQDKSELKASLDEALGKLNGLVSGSADLEVKLKAEQESNQGVLKERDGLQQKLEQQQQEQEQQRQELEEQRGLVTSLQQETEQRIKQLEQAHSENIKGLEQELEQSRGKLEQAIAANESLENNLEELRQGQSGIEQQHETAASELEKQLEQLRSELSDSQEQHKATQAELEQVNSRLKEADDRLQDSQQAGQDSGAELEQLQDALKQAEAEFKDLQATHQQAATEFQELQQAHQSAEAQLRELQDNQQSNEKGLGELEDAKRQAATELKQLQDTHQQTEAELEQYRDANTKIEAELEELKTSYRQAESDLQQERSLRQEAEAELAENEAGQAEDDEDELKVLQSELASLTEALEEADVAYDEIRERAELLAEEKEKTAGVMAELELDSTSAREQIQALTAELEQLRSAEEQAKPVAGDAAIAREADALREELSLVQKHSSAEIEELMGALATAESKLEELESTRGHEKADEESQRLELDELRESSKKWEQRVSETEKRCRSLEDAIEDRDERIDLITLELDEARIRFAEAESVRQQHEERMNLLRDDDEPEEKMHAYIDPRLAAHSGAVHLDDYHPGSESKRTMLLGLLIGAVICFILLEGVMIVAGKGELITGLLQSEEVVEVKPVEKKPAIAGSKLLPGPTTGPVIAKPEIKTTTTPEVTPEVIPEEDKPEPLWSVLNDIELGPLMVKLEGGSFTMGSNHSQVSSNERPAHSVELKSFAISRHEVTFDEYDRFAQATGRKIPSDEGWGRGKRPVINVSWDDAMSYTLWLSEKTGKRYRLPTESEWEFAIRGGSDSTYWWGYQVDNAKANCFDCGSEWDRKSTAPVGSFAPNDFSLHDMAGNVREWVRDCYQPSYEGAPTNGAPRLESGCNVRVVRGGAFNKTSDSMRSSWRGHFKQDSQLSFTGFRVVRELDDRR